MRQFPTLLLEITISENKTLMEELKQKDVKWSENPLYVRLDNWCKAKSAAFKREETW